MFEDRIIDRTIPVPLYYQLKQLIVEEIIEGKMKPEEAIPTEKEFSEMFDISRTTIRQALQELVQEGYLYRMKGRGTFVAKPKEKQSFMQRLTTYDNHIRALGKEPRTEILSCKVIPMPAQVAAELKCPKDSQAIELLRLRFADDEPVLTVHSFLPYSHCRWMLDEGMDLRHLYASMAHHPETRICKVVQTIEAVPAGGEDMKYLHIKRNCPIQLIQYIGYNEDGLPLECSYSRFRGDRNKFQCVVFVDEDTHSPVSGSEISL